MSDSFMSDTQDKGMSSQEAVPMTSAVFSERLASVKARIDEAARRSGRRPEDVLLVAVSKFHPASAVRQAVMAGQLVFGENYVQEAREKQAELANEPLLWHFIGHIQTNKAKDVAGRFSLIHTVDDVRLAEAISRRLSDTIPCQNVLLQVNLGDEPQKSGVAARDLHRLAESVLSVPRIKVLGLMGMPPLFDAGEAARPFFAKLRQLRDDLETHLGIKLPELSMGMSGDFEPAIEEGATIVRIGTTLFGMRPPKVQ